MVDSTTDGCLAAAGRPIRQPEADSMNEAGQWSRISNWWGLVLMPYLVGWIVGLIGAIRRLREGYGRSVPPKDQ